jgi:hypothetical protein
VGSRTLCLITAVLMLVMISPSADEVIATGQFLLQSRRAGKSLWRTFWTGGTVEGEAAEPETPAPGPSAGAFVSAMGLTTVPWNLPFSAALGLWLMVAPTVLGIQGAAADSHHVVGALVVTFAVIAIGEVARAARFLNVLFGAWILAAPWLLSGAGATACWSDVAVGALLILLSLPRGEVRERYGGWDRYIR